MDQSSEDSTLSEEELKFKNFIFQRKYPLEFSKGLSELNMRNFVVADRYKRFAKFFAATMREWDWSCAPPQALNLFSEFPSVPRSTVPSIVTEHKAGFCYVEKVYLWSWEDRPDAPISETEFRQWLTMNRKWPDKETLWWVAKKWLKWVKDKEESFDNSRAGIASGIARRDKNNKKSYKP